MREGRAVLCPTVEEQKAKYRSMISTLLEKAAKSGEIRVSSPKDIERLIKLDLLLTGEPTDRVKSASTMGLSDELKALLDDKIKELKEKNYPNP